MYITNDVADAVFKELEMHSLDNVVYKELHKNMIVLIIGKDRTFVRVIVDKTITRALVIDLNTSEEYILEYSDWNEDNILEITSDIVEFIVNIKNSISVQ